MDSPPPKPPIIPAPPEVNPPTVAPIPREMFSTFFWTLARPAVPLLGLLLKRDAPASARSVNGVFPFM